ncbi:MAG TPA: ABC transporter ATP-binding protein [Actinomycetes bacterium]|nr:ABC transporter ATP-binding protein [Actinomycetes bacterium]
MALPDLTVRYLHAYYGTAHVLFAVDLDVPGGATTAVLGRNGAGKTTLLRSIANAGVSTTGQVRYGELELTAMPSYRVARAGVALVPEDRRIFARLSVRDNLALAAQAAAGTARPALPVGEVVELFPLLGRLLDRPGYALSGGEQQLLAVGRAMVANPTLLLLDEPSEGLAPRVVEQVGEAIRRLRDEFDLSVVLAEQNTRFALELADSVTLIDGGTVVWSGTTAAFASNDAIAHRYLAV